MSAGARSSAGGAAVEIALAVLLVVLAAAMATWGMLDSLDARLYYTADEATAFLAELDPATRAAYFRNELMDLAFLSAYTLLIVRIIRRVYPHGALPVAIACTPGAFDLVETSTILLLLANGASPPAWLGATTFLKWTSGILPALTLIFGLRRSSKRI